ncbi:hypothetical protein GCK72_022964 [Caenorhabditis remanei]|uniref:Uncharacterized protein n=1 Tax=Caenorhabditis remanei TaxID=31234 RepID=A0A6A5FV68_CAERE|nr:hypothetical protein GCK72_022964 [Caenorhabditis remanei]KAF1746508.1 hypothetical protein GCK72_022964 [Caenorhabditis remanei]
MISCYNFNGALQRVSHALSGCFYNGTVYPIGGRWLEPNPGNFSTIMRSMTCYKSENGYYEKKVAGCDWMNLNLTSEYMENKYQKCIEVEPGKVDIVPVEKLENECTVDGKTFSGTWFNRKRGAILSCWNGKIHKNSCDIGGKIVWINNEVKLSNGCTFLCHPQTNVYSCDSPLQEFEITKDTSTALPTFHSI